MARDIVPLNQETHANLKLKDGNDFAHIANDNIVPLVVYEFMLAASEFPIIFIKTQDNRFQPAALLGLKRGDNLFVEEGKWVGNFIPGIAATYPFRLLPNPQDQNQLFVAIDQNSTLLSEDDGEPLFNEDKSETEVFKKRKEAVSKYFEFNHITETFCQLLMDMDLLTSRDLNLDLNGEKLTIQSVYLIDDQKLHDLSDEKFLELRKQGFLAGIYAHKNSLNQVRRLAEMSIARG